MNLSEDPSLKKIVISFAFNSDYGAAIYFDNNGYHLEKW